MSIRVQCQFCGWSSRVDDARAGQFMDCGNCRASLTVPDEPDQPGSASPNGNTVGVPWRRFFAGTVLLLGGLAALGLVVTFVAVHRGRNGRGPNPGFGVVPRIFPPARNGQRRQGGRPPAARPFAPIARRGPMPDSEGLPRIPVPWQVVVQPSAAAPTLPANRSVRIPIPEGPNPEIVFPSTPSTMVCVGNAGNGTEHREIWDYATNQRVGTTRGLRTMFEDLGGFFRPISALSPDGRLFVTQGLGPFELVAWDVAAERSIGTFEPKHPPTAGLSFGTFAGPGRLLACGQGVAFQILGVPQRTQKRMRYFPRENEYDRNSLAVSPDGGYLAVFDKSRLLLRFYDIGSALPAGQLSLPPFEPAGPQNCECVAFSPEGGEVAALFSYNGHSHLACWDLHRRHLVERIDFGGNLRTILGARLAYLFAPLEWFPGQSRWLVYGQGIVDRHAGKLIFTIPDEPNRMRYGIRHVAGPDSVLSVTDEGGKFVLGRVRLPLAEIDRAAEVATPAGKAETEGKR
jgi:hypothetical protein